MSPLPDQFKISRCYDSHVHWMPTGMVHSILNLSSLQCPNEIGQISIPKESYRGEWLMGFGWDQHSWPGQSLPNRKILDEIFPEQPIYFSRADGHAVWTNTAGLLKSGLLETPPDFTPEGGVICRDENGVPTGVLIERAKELLDPFLPPYTRAQELSFLKKSTSIFNQAGFSHIRDLGGDARLWELAIEMDQSSELSLYVEVNFCFFKEEELSRTIELALAAKESQTTKLRSQGVKFFLDGALGSEGAYLSQSYPGTESRGLLLWSTQQVGEFLRRIWEAGLEAAVHCIGDAACEILATEALRLKDKEITGVLNVEHGQVIGEKTVGKLKALGARVHLQPCHWLSDHFWLKQKLGSLYDSVFPWAELERQGVEFFFGSDSPIEPPSVANNLEVLSRAQAEGIPAPAGEALLFHSHPDKSWGSDCYSIFNQGKLTELYIDGHSTVTSLSLS